MRLTMFYKSQHALVALPLPAIVQLPIRPSPRYPHAFQLPYCSTDAYKFSFFPRTVVQWNNLPASIAMAPPHPSSLTLPLPTLHLLLTTPSSPCLCVIVKIDRVTVPYTYMQHDNTASSKLIRFCNANSQKTKALVPSSLTFSPLYRPVPPALDSPFYRPLAPALDSHSQRPQTASTTTAIADSQHPTPFESVTYT